MEESWDESDYNIDWAVDHENGWRSTQEDVCHGPPYWTDRWINGLWNNPDTTVAVNLACFEREILRCPTTHEWENISQQFVAAKFQPIPDVDIPQLFLGMCILRILRLNGKLKYE